MPDHQRAPDLMPLFKYKAFVSYSHQSDSVLASELQRKIERLGKPWYLRRVIALFRDETDLAVNPDLWPRIVTALDSSEFLLLLASTAAAQSRWVSQEVEYWKSKRDPAKLVVALTGGEIVWDNQQRDFDWELTNAVPPVLRGFFSNEPLWADFRATQEQGNATRDRYREPAVRLAAGLRGMAPRELEGEELRQHHRTIRFATTGLITLLILLIAAVIATFQAIRQRDFARSRQLAALSTARLATDPAASVLLALRAREVLPTSEAEQSLRSALAMSYQVRSFHVTGDEYVNGVSFSYDGKRIVTSSGWSLFGKLGRELKAQVWDVETGKLLATLPHTTTVKGALFSPDGKLVITAAGDPIVRLWDVPSGKLLANLSAEKADDTKLRAVSFSPNGNYVAAGYSDSTVVLWRMNAGYSHVALDQLDAVNSIAFSPDSSTILIATGESRISDHLANGLFASDQDRFRVSLWDVQTARERLRLPTFTGPVWVAHFSPDGRRIVTAGDDGVARLWDASTARKIAELRGHSGQINSAAFSLDGRWLATASSDTTARVWDAQTGALRMELRGNKHSLFAVLLTSDGSIAITPDGNVATVWDVATGKTLGELRGGPSALTDIGISPKHDQIATTSHDGVLRLWSIPSAALVESMGPMGSVDTIALSPNGERILVHPANGGVSVWHRRTGMQLASIPSLNPFSSPVWSRDGRWVLAPTGTYHGLLYDAGTGKLVKELRPKELEFRNAALSPDGKRIFSFEEFHMDGKGYSFVIWDIATDKPIAAVPFKDGIDSGSIDISPDGTRLTVNLAGNGGSQLRDCTTGALIKTFPGRRLRFSPSGRRLLELIGDDNVPHVYDALSGQHLAKLGEHGSVFGPDDASFVQDDQHVITFDDSTGKTMIWDIEGPRIVAEFTMENLGVGAKIVLSPDGRFLASIAATNKNTVSVWDLHSHSKLAELHGHIDTVSAAVFAPDGSLITGSADGTLRSYPLEDFAPIPELLDRAQKIVSHQFADFERSNLPE